MQIDLVNIAVMWCLALVCMAVAINAQGWIRGVATAFITLAVFGIAGFFTSLKFSSIGDLFAQDSSLHQMEMQKPETSEHQPNDIAIDNSNGKEDPQKATEYIAEATKLILQAMNVAYQINSFDIAGLGDLSDTEYEKMESKARNIRGLASAISRNIKRLSPQLSQKELDEKLNNAAEDLRLAGYRLHSYFSAEDEAQEESYHSQSLRHSKLAIEEFKKLKFQITGE
jgi:hypothetical protein